MDIMQYLRDTGCIKLSGVINPDRVQTVTHILKRYGYEMHHSASIKGYMSRKVTGLIDRYSGRFGTGFTIETPRTDTTNYHTITYYVKEN